jgi:general secretion pathway protein K
MSTLLKPTMVASARSRHHAGESGGFVLIAVLWILLMLATLAAIFSVAVRNSALALTANDADLETELLASAGLELAAWQLSGSEAEERPSHGRFRARVGRAGLLVKFVSETARVDLNQAPKPLLAGLLVTLGAREADAERFADRIIGWRSEPKAGAAEREASLYRAAGLTYVPRGAPFAHVQELWLVQGLPSALIERALPFVTVYSGQARINIMDAAPEVLAALPDMTPDRLSNFLERRETVPLAPKSAAEILGFDEPLATIKPGVTARVDVRITFDDGHSAAAQAVILLGDDTEPYRVLSWQDASLGPAVPSHGERK